MIVNNPNLKSTVSTIETIPSNSIASDKTLSASTPCKFSYWLRLFIYLGLAICTPFATFLTGLTPAAAEAMTWYSWTGQILTCLVSAMVTIRAYLDTTAGRQASDKEWEEYLADVKTDAKEMVAIAKK